MSSSRIDEKPVLGAKCSRCYQMLKSGPKYRTKRSPSIFCSRCAVGESLKGKHLMEQFCGDTCAICWEEKPTVHFTCETGRTTLIGHSFCKTCVLKLRALDDFSNLGDDDDDDYDEDDDGKRITEVEGQLQLRLPDLLPWERLLCPLCRGEVLYAVKENAISEDLQVTDSPSSDGGFVIPKGAVVVDLTSDDGDIGSRKRKRGEELSSERKRACHKAKLWNTRAFEKGKLPQDQN
ncbi:hypothetical protein CEP54_014976 [Fusarium duplospermum]|uniref:Uncharacterized protein n=1 Tax=Fusarium duplospermum TaxID=1325734 RepID=A0A428NSJ0_9HYPO|nr:hypothetical protein CEP54_014976 [Fusarium duplospermum]